MGKKTFTYYIGGYFKNPVSPLTVSVVQDHGDDSPGYAQYVVGGNELPMMVLKIENPVTGVMEPVPERFTHQNLDRKGRITSSTLICQNIDVRRFMKTRK